MTPKPARAEAQVPDKDLVIAARDGSRDAFATLYDRYAGLARAIAYDRCGDTQRANELAQEAFLRAYRSLDQLREPDRFVSWLIQITRFVAAESHRTDQRHRRIAESLASGLASPAATLPGAGADTLELQELQDKIAELPEPDRTAIRLFYLAEHSADNARAVLGLSRSGFYKVIGRAKKRLRQQLDPASGAEA